MRKPLYYPRIWPSLQMLFLYQFVFFLIPFVILTWVFRQTGGSHDDLWIQIISTLVAFSILLGWLSLKYRLNLKAYVTISGWKIQYLIPMVLLLLGTDILVSEFVNRMQLVLPMNKQVGDTLMGLFGTEAGLGKSFLLVVILAPVCEEVIFRGLILRGFLKHYTVKKAIFVSAVLFGLFHMNVWQFPGALVWGMIAGWWFVRTGSLFFCMSGHAFMNGIGFLAMFIKNRWNLIIPGFSSDYGELVFQPLWFTIMGLIGVAMGLIFFQRMFRRTDRS